MLQADYINNTMPRELVELFYDIEKELMVEVVKNLKIGRQKPEQVAQKLQSILAKYENSIANITSKTVQSASEKSLNAENAIYNEAKKRDIEHGEPLDKEGIKPIVFGITAGAIGLAKSIQNKMLNSAMTNYMTGYEQLKSMPLPTAEKLAIVVKQLAPKGLSIYEATAGGKVLNFSVESAIRRNIITAVNTATGKIAEANFDRMETNLVEVSSHLGARPEHAEWQGKRYWWKKPVEGYDEFVSSTGYGEMLGLKGINCYHDFSPVYEFMKTSTYKNYNEKRNNRVYNLQQQQRSLERAIKKNRIQEELFKTAGLNNEAKKFYEKAKNYEAKLIDLVKNNKELKRYPWKEKI